MDLGLTGRVGLVTGAGGELREATERLLREEGAEVREPPADDRIDFVVNFVDGSPVEDRRAAFELRVMAPMRTMKALAPALAERGRGRIVNVVPPVDPVTAAAAAALSRLFADRYAKQGVLVNAIAPASSADPAAVAREVAFLCSARASHVAGATWAVADTAEVID